MRIFDIITIFSIFAKHRISEYQVNSKSLLEKLKTIENEISIMNYTLLEPLKSKCNKLTLSSESMKTQVEILIILYYIPLFDIYKHMYKHSICRLISI